MSYWDKYRNSHEPKEHWALRLKFLETHKDSFDEDRLLCLAQVFYNVEFLGCKYPDKVMKQIEELSQGIIDDHREQKKSKIQRTFVKASEAAEAKVCRTGVKRKHEDEEQDSPSKRREGNSVQNILGNRISTTSTGLDLRHIESYLDRDPPLSQLILVRMKNETTLTFEFLQRSVKFSGMSMDFKFLEQGYQKYLASLKLKCGNQNVDIVSLPSDTISKPKQKLLKASLLELAHEKLSGNHFTIVINNQFYSSQETIEKTEGKRNQDCFVYSSQLRPKTSCEESKQDQTGFQEVKGQEDQRGGLGSKEEKTEDDKKEKKFISDDYEKLAENNLGSKLLKLMGWSGSGGLGKSGQGISEPVPITGRLDNRRVGLGQDTPLHSSISGGEGEEKMGLNVKKQSGLTGPQFKFWARELLQEYAHSTHLLWFEDLIFSTSFSKEERATLHSICQTNQYRGSLVAKSYGKDDARHLVISRKVAKNGRAILADLIQWGDNPKFSLEIPENFHTWKG